MRWLLACSFALAQVGVRAAAAEDDPAEAVRGLALAEMADAAELAQLDVASSVTSVGGVLGASSALAVGIGRGFSLVAFGTVHEDNAAREMGRTADLGGALTFAWGEQRISQLRLGVTRAIGTSDDLQARGGAALRTQGSAWVALALDVGVGQRLDGTFAAAIGAGSGPIVPTLEAKLGRCHETCAMGSFGVRVRLPAAFELGLGVIGEALPARQVGMAISFHWSQRLLDEE